MLKIGEKTGHKRVNVDTSNFVAVDGVTLYVYMGPPITVEYHRSSATCGDESHTHSFIDTSSHPFISSSIHPFIHSIRLI